MLVLQIVPTLSISTEQCGIAKSGLSSIPFKELENGIHTVHVYAIQQHRIWLITCILAAVKRLLRISGMLEKCVALQLLNNIK